MTKISALSDIGTSVASNDTFVLVDVSDPTTPNKKIQQQNLFLIPDGSAGTPGLRFLSDTNVGLFRPTTDTLAIATGGSERLRIDSSGRLGLGTSSPTQKLEIGGAGRSTLIVGSTNSYAELSFAGATAENYITSDDTLAFYINTLERLRIDTSGRVGIGVNAPDPGGQGLHVHNASAADSSVRITNSTTGATNGDGFAIQVASDGTARLRQFENVALTFETNATERGRWDSSGRFLVGTSTARTNFFNSSVSAISQVEEVGGGSAAYSAITNVAGATGPAFVLGKTRGTSAGSNTVVNSGDQLGTLSFQGSDGSEFVEGAIIRAEVDGTPGANDMPCRLVFSVTADGASSPTEAMRIKNSRIINIANTPTYADNAAAKAGGLVDGDVYRTSTGVLMIVYT